MSTSRLGSVQAVEKGRVDLNRYLGHWYEIDRYNSWFEWGGSTDNTATYTINDDGVIGVINQCKGQPWWCPTQVIGVAKIGIENDTSKLLVRFSSFMQWAHYWILMVGEPRGQYDLYPWAVVGTPDRKFLWILSRTSMMSLDDHRMALHYAKYQGFDVEKLVHVQHTNTGSVHERMLSADFTPANNNTAEADAEAS